MDPFAFLLLGAATWRLSVMVVREDGPLNSFFRLRSWAGITHDEDRHILIVPDRFLPSLLSCVWCSSVWIAAGWTILWILLPSVALLLATVFALSATAIVADRWLVGQRSP